MKRSGVAHRFSPPYALGEGGATSDAVKLEITEDELEEEYAPFSKRMRHSSFHDQLITGNDLLSVPPSQYNPLEEPSPLGLRLKKSPSLLELIQMRLAQGNNSTAVSSSSSTSKENTESREGAMCSISAAASSSSDKLKASNFHASLLRIGQWEYASKHEGDLVAKCYFAKHKLVWEVLDGGLKSKIEIQWSDIVGLNAKFPEDGPATMTVVLAREPLFFRETNPQPRKHTLWQAAPDFTNNQASTHRQHLVQVPFGVLNKHFEKLTQCDMRLNYLCRQPEMVLDSPYFESLAKDLEDSKDSAIHTLGQRVATEFSTLPDGASQSVPEASLVLTEQANLARSKNLIHEVPSLSSVMEEHATEGCLSTEAESLREPKKWEQLIMQGLRPSMSMTDLVNHIGSCISGQDVSTHNPSLEEEGTESRKILQGIAQHLLGDSQVTCSDEKSLMKRVNSLCSLLNKDGLPVETSPAAEHLNQKESSRVIESAAGNSKESSPSCKPSMPRKDSYGDLLHNLPRIASLPTFLYDISEGDESRAR